MATISNTPRPGYVWDSTDNCWYPIGVGNHNHSEIQKTIVDAKGDLIVGTANDTVARQAVGTDGQTLIADSTQTNGVRWTDQLTTAGKNAIINGGFDIWQRGTSIANTAVNYNYTADRWCVARGSNATGATVSRQTTNDTTNLPNIQYCARVQRDSGNTSTQIIYFANSFETVNSIPYAGKTVVLSFYARAGANYSAASGALNTMINTGTGTDQNERNGYTGESNIGSTNVTLTTTWQRFTTTGTIPTTATEIAPRFSYTPVGTASTNDYFEITGVQLELGSVATPFARTGGTIQGELAVCQRYYYRQGGAQTYNWFAQGAAYSTTGLLGYVVLPVTMRTTPTAVEYSTLCLNDGANALVTVTSATLSSADSGTNNVRVNFGVASGLTQYRFYGVVANNSTSAYLGLTAEL